MAKPALIEGMLTKREELQKLSAQLDLQRATFLQHWRELGDYILPRRMRFSVKDVNHGDRRNRQIIDSTATLSARTLRSGMMSGVTSPARPWFRLTTPDQGLAETAAVKQWLYIVSDRMAMVFSRSNLYNCLPIIYGDMGVFGTAAMAIEEDFESVIRCYPLPIGSYSIGNNYRLKVDVCVRNFQMTVRQIVNRFGQDEGRTGKIDWSNISDRVKSAWQNGRYEEWIDVTQVVRPNRDFDPRKLQSKFKAYSSDYFEAGAGAMLAGQSDTPNDRFLREKGFDFFPILCPRWEVTGEDSYGTACPGMDSLGDIKQVQTGEKRGAQAIEKMINPAMVGPVALRTAKISLLPGDTTFVDVREGMQGFKPAHEVNFRLTEHENKQQMIRERIKRGFYEDLFLMLSQQDRSGITAREVQERHEEKLLALGPVLEQLNQDLLDPLISVSFQIMNNQGQIPPPPKELSGQPLRVEYISIMAQAQKLIGIESVERFSSFVGQVAHVAPDVIDKIDVDQMIDIYGDMTSIPPGIIRPDDQVAQIRQQKQQAQQQQAQMQAAQQQAQTAQTLSQTDTGGGSNALQQLLDQAKSGALAPAR